MHEGQVSHDAERGQGETKPVVALSQVFITQKS